MGRKHSHERRSREEGTRHRSIDKKHKDRTRRQSSSGERETPEERIERRLKKMAEERKSIKDNQKKQKEQLKAMETPEEKRMRRLMKKEEKEKRRKERMGWDQDYLHYTNSDNPFGDNNLLDTFVWKKKLEKEGKTDITTDELEACNRQKQEENKVELEKVKKRRLEREQERAARDDEMQSVQRSKEAKEFELWEKQEDNFHLQQARLRSKIRIEDGRAKPIDLLGKYISAEDEDDLTVEVHEPYMYLNGLQIRDLEDLLEDIEIYKQLEKGKNLDYWSDITIIVHDELHRLRKMDPKERESYGNRREGIHSSVKDDVLNIFKGKSVAQLLLLNDQINKKISSGEDGVDIVYWESLLSQLKAYMARGRLRDRHQENLRKKLYQLKQEQGVEAPTLFPSANAEVTFPSQPSTSQSQPDKQTDQSDVRNPSTSAEPVPGPSKEVTDVKGAEPQEESASDDDDIPIITETDLLDQSFTEYETGCYSPQLTAHDRVEPGTLLVDPSEDKKRVEFARQKLKGSGDVRILSAEERKFEQVARMAMEDDEALFSVEQQLDHKVYLWSDKYRPRKPRYFNRVHTGFEWNKYNQTHYDIDNPPPKIVQGYKFNIFFPDLIDKGFTPEYTLTACGDNKDFAILRFHAGPPYEDIAFKIVNREWEYSYKRGFRCQFHNNIFQLWFHFKRYRYRR